MNDIKLVAFDLDGTILPMGGTVASDRFCNCVRQGLLRGVVFAPFTGRSMTTIPAQITELPGMRYLSYSNGAGIFDTLSQSCIYSELMPLGTCLETLRYLEQYDLIVLIISNGKLVFERRIYENRERYPLMPHHITSMEDGTAILVDSLIQYLLKDKPNVDKISILEVLGEERAKIFSDLAKSDKVYAVSSCGTNMEINSLNTSKGNALGFLAAHLGIELQNVMALGDNNNDITMLEVAGLGVAVENASDEAKAVANYITEAQDNDGAAIAIEQFVLDGCTVAF